MARDNLEDYSKIRDMMQDYARGHGADRSATEAILELFHPQALVTGYLDGKLYIESPKFIRDFILGLDDPGAMFANLHIEIQSIEVYDEIATVKTVGTGFGSMGNFIDNLQLVKTESGDWKVMSKTFTFA